MLYKEIFEKMLKHIKSLLHSEAFLSLYAMPKRFVRKRLLSMYQLIMYLFYTNKACMSTNAGNIRDDLFQLDFPVISKQAISKARQNIKPELFQALFEATIDIYYSMTQTYNLWKGYHIYAIDGSCIHMPESDSVRDEFGFQGDTRYEDSLHYMGLSSTLYDISQDIVVHAVIEYVNTSERVLAKKHIEKLQQLSIAHKALIIFDRGYYSAALFDFLNEKGFKCLMRIKKSTTSLTNSEEEDCTKELPAGSDIRVIQAELNTGETEYLVTNVFDQTITNTDFYDLYHLRWKIESKYYELKSFWSLEKFNGATSISIRQEFFITLTKANICSVIKNEADKEIVKQEKDKESKKHYQCCRSHLIGRLSNLLPKYINDEDTVTTVDDLLKEAIRNKSLVRPNRFGKRKKPKKYPKHLKNRKTTT